MTLLERLLGHDEATTRELLLRCQALSAAQLTQAFDVGWQTVAATVEHLLYNLEVWTDMMLGRVPRDTPESLSAATWLARFEQGYADFRSLALAIESAGRMDDLWTDTLDVPPRAKSFGGGIGHLITHHMHHRAELLHILQRLGLADLPEGDLMSWDTQARRGR